MFESAIRRAIYSELNGAIDIGSGEVPVYDHVPQPADAADASDYPYIVIGETTYVPWDTDTEVGAEATVTIHTWSRYRGKKEILEIHDAIYSVLHRQDIPVDGSFTIGCDYEQSDSFDDS